jgi:hypothetical protein
MVNQHITAKQNTFLTAKLSEDDNSKMIWAIDQIKFESYNFEFNLYDAIICLCENYDYNFSNFDADAILEHLDNTIQAQNSFR